MFKGFDNITHNDFFQVIKHNFERPHTQNLQTTGAHQVQLHLALCPSSSCLIIRWQFVQPYKTVGLVSP